MADALEKDKKAIEKSLKKIHRNFRIQSLLFWCLPWISLALCISGYLSLLALPFLKNFHSNHYISENALQIGSSHLKWDWADVHKSDVYADHVKRWSSLSHSERAIEIEKEFKAIGLITSTQQFSYSLPTNITLNGSNVHALFRAPKTDGSEAIVLAASWFSRSEPGAINERGVSSVLGLARYFSKYAYWSKDILFVIGDGYTEGINAWLAAYHDTLPSNLVSTRLSAITGPIWLALSLDYPYHSFSHLSLYYEGLDAHVPNLDIVNTVIKVCTNVVAVPITLHGTPGHGVAQNWKEEDDDALLTNKLGLGDRWKWMKSGEVALKNAARQTMYAATGSPSGPEGLFGKYAIDSVGIYGVPAEGPHGFYTIGRVVDATFRSFNNLLERLHHSQTLYLMLNPTKFLGVSVYLFSTLALGASVFVKAIYMWISLSNNDFSKSVVQNGIKNLKQVQAPGDKSLNQREEEFKVVLKSMGQAYEAGGVLGVSYLASTLWYGTVIIFSEPIRFLNLILIASPALLIYILRGPVPPNTPYSPTRTIPSSARLLSIFQHFTLGLSICVLSINNFGFAIFLSLTLIPLAMFVAPNPIEKEWSEKKTLSRLFGTWVVVGFSMCVILLRGTPFVEKILYEFVVLGARTIPLFAMLVLPQLLISLGIGCAIEGGLVLAQ